MFQLDGTLDEVDPEIAQIIRSEKERQVRRACAADCWRPAWLLLRHVQRSLQLFQ